MYQYSLDAFNTFLQKAIDRTQVVETCWNLFRNREIGLVSKINPKSNFEVRFDGISRCFVRPFLEDSEDVKERTERLIASIRITIFRWAWAWSEMKESEVKKECEERKGMKHENYEWNRETRKHEFLLSDICTTLTACITMHHAAEVNRGLFEDHKQPGIEDTEEIKA